LERKKNLENNPKMNYDNCNRKAQVVKDLHEKVRNHIVKKNEKYAYKANKGTMRLSLGAYVKREVS
jgi:RNA polymerase-interacting CarD/CdnL/TRCF family regulator